MRDSLQHRPNVEIILQPKKQSSNPLCCLLNFWIKPTGRCLRTLRPQTTDRNLQDPTHKETLVPANEEQAAGLLRHLHRSCETKSENSQRAACTAIDLEMFWGRGTGPDTSPHTHPGKQASCSGHIGKQSGTFLKTINTHLPYDPAIPLGLFPRVMKIYINTETHREDSPGGGIVCRRGS